MKKLIFSLSLIIGLISVKETKAQNGTGNASDHGVPVPVVTPQATPTGLGVNAVNAPAITVPTAPPVQTFTGPVVTPTTTVTAGNLMPAVPSAPAPPPAPAPGTPPPSGSFTTTLNLPFTPTLPPIPPIPPMPDVRVPIGSN